MKIWDASHPPSPSSSRARPSRRMESRAICVACSPDGRRIAAGYADNAVRVWDTASRPYPVDTHGPRQAGASAWRSARSVRPSPRRSQDQTVRLWDAATGQLRASASRSTPGRSTPRVQPGRPPPGLLQRRRHAQGLGPATGQCLRSIPAKPERSVRRGTAPMAGPRLGRLAMGASALGRRDRSAPGDHHRPSWPR